QISTGFAHSGAAAQPGSSQSTRPSQSSSTPLWQSSLASQHSSRCLWVHVPSVQASEVHTLPSSQSAAVSQMLHPATEVILQLPSRPQNSVLHGLWSSQLAGPVHGMQSDFARWAHVPAAVHTSVVHGFPSSQLSAVAHETQSAIVPCLQNPPEHTSVVQ